MNCTQGQPQVSVSLFPSSQLTAFPPILTDFCLTPLSNLALEVSSPWNLSRLLQFLSYTHSVTYYFHWFTCPLPMRCNDSRPRERLRCLLVPCRWSHHRTHQDALEMADLTDGAFPSQISSSFQTPFTKHLPGARSIFSLWRAVLVPIPDKFLLHFAAKPLILRFLIICENVLDTRVTSPMKDWSSNGSWNIKHSLNI